MEKRSAQMKGKGYEYPLEVRSIWTYLGRGAWRREGHRKGRGESKVRERKKSGGRKENLVKGGRGKRGTRDRRGTRGVREGGKLPSYFETKSNGKRIGKEGGPVKRGSPKKEVSGENERRTWVEKERNTGKKAVYPLSLKRVCPGGGVRVRNGHRPHGQPGKKNEQNKRTKWSGGILKNRGKKV